MQVYDIKQKHPEWVKDVFYNSLDDIKNSNNTLKHNYTIDRLKLEEMLVFNVLLKDKELICFGGVQVDSPAWSEGMARVTSRHYFNPKFFHLFRHRYNWEYLVSEQIRVGWEEGYDKFFFSTELMEQGGGKGEVIFKKTCRTATNALRKRIDNIVVRPLEGHYNTIPNGKSWQRIGQIILGDNEWDIGLEEK